MELVLHLYSCVTTNQVLWTDQLRNMQSASAELSMEDKTQEMLVVRESRPTRSHSEVLAEGCVSVEEQGVPNQQQGIAEGEF